MKWPDESNSLCCLMFKFKLKLLKLDSLGSESLLFYHVVNQGCTTVKPPVSDHPKCKANVEYLNVQSTYQRKLFYHVKVLMQGSCPVTHDSFCNCSGIEN